MFAENGEVTDLSGNEITSGRKQIQARYEEIFSDKPLRVALEVDSVRLITPGLAIEDGTFHHTLADDESAPPRSTTDTAVLMKGKAETWHIASPRSLKDVTEAAGHPAALADALKGEWTNRATDGVRLDLAFEWDATGRHITGEMLTSTADAEPQEGSIRIAWDASKQPIVSWMFSNQGGFSHGIWTPDDEGWLIRSEGVCRTPAIAASDPSRHHA